MVTKEQQDVQLLHSSTALGLARRNLRLWGRRGFISCGTGKSKWEWGSLSEVGCILGYKVRLILSHCRSTGPQGQSLTKNLLL